MTSADTIRWTTQLTLSLVRPTSSTVLLPPPLHPPSYSAPVPVSGARYLLPQYSATVAGPPVAVSLVKVAGIYTFDGGRTVIFGCGEFAFTYPAFELDGATLSPQTMPISTTPVVGTAGSSSRPMGSAATSPASSTSSSASSSGKNTVEIVVIVVLGVVAVTFFAIFLYFLKQVYGLHRSKYKPVAQRPSDSNGTPQPEKGLSRWSKIAGIASPLIALALLGVSLYVAMR